MHVRVAGAYFEGKMGYRIDQTSGVATGAKNAPPSQFSYGKTIIAQFSFRYMKNDQFTQTGSEQV